LKIFGTIELYCARFLYHFQKVFNSDTYIDYLERTLRSYFPRKIYLIQDNASYHKDKIVWAWFSQHRKYMEVFNLPAYSPELNALGLFPPDTTMISTLRRTVGPLMRNNGKRIVSFALKSRLPSTYAHREAVDAGGLMYYGADLAESYRRVAYYVDKILKGAKPADLPVEQPTKFELVINLKTAKQIGLTIPPEVLARANKLIK